VFSTDADRRPKRPLVTSLAGALEDVRRWQEENRLDVIKDGEGQPWAVEVRVVHGPNHQKPKGLLWNLKVLLTARVGAEDLKATCGFDAKDDARLLALVGDSVIDLSVRPLTYTAETEEAARLLIADVLPRLRASFARNALVDVKRQLVGRWVDEHSRFGGEGLARRG
jgi:hypothetical protein